MEGSTYNYTCALRVKIGCTIRSQGWGWIEEFTRDASLPLVTTILHQIRKCKDQMNSY